MYEFAKAIRHSLCPGAVPSLCHRQLQGQVSAWGPSGDPSRVGSLGAPTLQLSHFWGTDWTNPYAPVPRWICISFLVSFSFSNKPPALPQPPGRPCPVCPRAWGLHSGCCEDPNPFVSTSDVAQHRSLRIRLHPHVLCKMDLCRVVISVDFVYL